MLCSIKNKRLKNSSEWNGGGEGLLATINAAAQVIVIMYQILDFINSQKCSYYQVTEYLQKGAL